MLKASSKSESVKPYLVYQWRYARYLNFCLEVMTKSFNIFDIFNLLAKNSVCLTSKDLTGFSLMNSYSIASGFQSIGLKC